MQYEPNRQVNVNNNPARRFQGDGEDTEKEAGMAKHSVFTSETKAEAYQV